MRIEQLEYLAAVTTHGSLRRASEAMHISQPALSEAVTKLEKELGTTLLDRRRTGSRISRQGLDLLQNMTEVLEAVDRLRQAAGDQAVRMRELIQGRPVACLRTDHPLAARERVSVEDLRAEPFVSMRPGYVMHRFAHRLFDGAMPATTYATDGAGMGKAMVAAGLGLSILPDYSVSADPLVTAGVITTRPIGDDRTTVSLLMLRRKADRVPEQLRDLEDALAAHAGAYLSRTGRTR